MRGAAGTFVLNGFALVMCFVLALLLSRLLGASGYGAYTFAFASASLLTAPAVLGLTPVLVRNIAAYKAHGRWAELKGIVRRSNQTVFATSLVLAVGAAAGAAFSCSMPAVTSFGLYVPALRVPGVAR